MAHITSKNNKQIITEIGGKSSSKNTSAEGTVNNFIEFIVKEYNLMFPIALLAVTKPIVNWSAKLVNNTN